MKTKKQNIISTLLLASLGFALVASCDNSAPPTRERSFSKMKYYHLAEGTQEIKSPLIELLAGATTSVDIALARLEDDAVADALIAARTRGVTVRVVTDTQSMADSGFVKLLAAGVPITSGDGEVRYLPDPTLTSILEACIQTAQYRECTRRGGGAETPDDGVMIRPDDYNVMTSNFAVVDDFNVWVSATPLIAGGTVGVGWTAYSQDLGIAFLREFQQMAGGVFASTLDLFNGPVKSTVHGILYDSRIPDATPGRYLQLQPGYVTNEGIVNIQFNPQQRLVKELIDEIYRARGSVFFMTDELIHDFAISAIRYKVNAGFDVRVIVREGTLLPTDLVQLGVVKTIADVEYLPTVLITDHTRDRNGREWARTAMSMTHPMYRSAPFEVITPEPDSGLENDLVRIYPSDFFVDGTLWTMQEFLDNRREENEVERLTVRWLNLWNERAKLVAAPGGGMP